MNSTLFLRVALHKERLSVG